MPVKHCQSSCWVPSAGAQGWWCCWSRRAAEPGCLPGSRPGPSLSASPWPEGRAEYWVRVTAGTSVLLQNKGCFKKGQQEAKFLKILQVFVHEIIKAWRKQMLRDGKYNFLDDKKHACSFWKRVLAASLCLNAPPAHSTRVYPDLVRSRANTQHARA